MAVLSYALVVVLAVVASIDGAPQMKDKDDTYSMYIKRLWTGGCANARAKKLLISSLSGVAKDSCFRKCKENVECAAVVVGKSGTAQEGVCKLMRNGCTRPSSTVTDKELYLVEKREKPTTDPSWAFRMYTSYVNKYPGAEAYFKKVSNKKFLYVIKDGKKTDNYMLDYSSWPVQLKTGTAALRQRPDLKMTMTAEMFNKFRAPYMKRGLTEQQFDEEFNKIGLAEAVSNGQIKFEGDFILTMTLHKVWRFDYYIQQNTMDKIYI